MKNTKTYRRNRIRQRIKKVISGTPDYPRLSVFRSNKEIYCQIIDDVNGKTLMQTSSRDKAILDKQLKTNSEISFNVGKLIAEQAVKAGIDKIKFDKPLDILAYQYDIVCNGVELSSGAIRNHIPELMYKLFSIAGYSKQDVDQKFSGMINALSYGAPPHGGIAPGIDRIVMLLANEKNIREVTMFPMNQNAQDLMMNAPSDVTDKQLKELNISLKSKK